MKTEAMVTVETYASEVAAEGAAACLEANGIHCTLTADDCGGMLSAMDNFSGVRLIVAAERDRFDEVLEQIHASFQ